MLYHLPSRRSQPKFSLEALLSVAGLSGVPVSHRDGQEVGRLVDLVCRWDSKQRYPALSGVLTKVGRRIVWIPADEIMHVDAKGVRLKTTKLDLRDFQPRSGEARLMADVLDHQLVDVEGARVVRASDLYLAASGDVFRLVAVDISYLSLLKRLAPRRFRGSPSLRAVVDWSTIQSFGRAEGGASKLRLSANSRELRRLKPAELADLLEDLGRSERQELLQALPIEQAADALEEMQADELESLLRESSPEKAAAYLAKMEPDESAEALRSIDGDLQDQLIGRLPADAARRITTVLSHQETTAGGIMNPVIVTVAASETVGALAERLRQNDQSESVTTAVAVTDNKGRLLDDLNFGDLFIAQPTQKIEKLISSQPPVTLHPDDDIAEVADRLIANRRSSVLVVDADNHPVGRILADDLIDALLPEDGRFHFPRIFS